jgi:hypothetical protein
VRDWLNAHPSVLVFALAVMALFFGREFAGGWRTGEASARGISQVLREANPFIFWFVMAVNGSMAIVCIYGATMVWLGR